MKLIAITLALFPTLALAGGFDVYTFNLEKVPAVHARLVADFDTHDACNLFGLAGALRDATPANSLEQLFVADFDTVQTEMGCPGLARPRHVHLESRTFEIRAIHGRIFARVLVPNGLKLQMVNRPEAD